MCVCFILPGACGRGICAIGLHQCPMCTEPANYSAANIVGENFADIVYLEKCKYTIASYTLS